MAQFEFEFTFSDYIHSQKLHATRSLWSLSTYLLFIIIFPVLGAIGALLGMLMLHAGDRKNSLIEFVCSLVLLLFPLLIRLNWWYCYTRTRSDSGHRNFVFTDDFIRTETEYSRGEVDWPAIRSFKENAKVLLLYIAPAKFFVIPKRACSREQLDELQSLIVRHKTPAKGLRSLTP